MKLTLVLSSAIFGSSLFNSGTQVTTNETCSVNFFTSPKSFVKPVGTVYIIIDKSDYELHVYDQKGWYATYPVVFGASPMEDKKMEGDRRTPEGTFKIAAKKPHEKWYRFMALDYPNRESIEKFNKRKERGEIPSSARIGGSIGIHGTWPHEDYQIDRYKNWTLGCISMKNDDVQELYNYVPVGTTVTIRK